MFHRMIQLVALCSMIIILFVFASGNAFAAQKPTKSISTKGTGFPTKITLTDSKKSNGGVMPPLGITLGSLCTVQSYGYELYSGELAGSTETKCDGTVTVIDNQNQFEYCTAAIHGSTICLGSWQTKAYGTYCVTGPTANQNCPGSSDDQYKTGTNALWAFVSNTCVEFPSGTVDCGVTGTQVWMG